MYTDKLTVRRLGPGYLVITGYVGQVKKTLPVEPATLRQFITDAEYALSLEEPNTDGYANPPKRGRKPRASEMPSEGFAEWRGKMSGDVVPF